MTYRGRIENGVVVFDETAPLANGTRVRVEPDVHRAVTGTPGEELLRFQGLIDPDSMKEMAAAIEHDLGRVDLDEW